jgi:protein required for attachment to host cells
MEPRTGPKTHEKQVFAGRIAELINGAAMRKSFDQLVLVAPPKTLAELRTQLGENAKRLIIGELDRDLVKMPASELTGHLSDVLT